MFYHTSNRFQVEEHQVHGPNFSRFQLASEGQRWFGVGYYLAPNDALKIERIFTDISHHPHGATLMVAGDFNTDLEKS